MKALLHRGKNFPCPVSWLGYIGDDDMLRISKGQNNDFQVFTIKKLQMRWQIYKDYLSIKQSVYALRHYMGDPHV